MTIEQTLMRSMKSCGGLIKGVESIQGAGTVDHRNGLYAEHLQESGAFWIEHVDMRPSQIIRDNADVDKLKSWFILHPPLLVTDKLSSISSGVVESDYSNCHMTQEVGTEGMVKIVGNTFGKVTFKRKDTVVTLASVNSSVKVANRRVDNDPLTIFQRACITKQSNEELKKHFKYELARFPLSLFIKQRMRGLGPNNLSQNCKYMTFCKES